MFYISFRKRAVLIAVACGFCLVLWFCNTRLKTSGNATTGWIYNPRNSTLGFERILVLNTPERTDRRRNMQALASYHDLKLDYSRTYNQRESDALAAKHGYLLNGTHLACYLSHLNAYRRMVDENIQTALILEDDVDMELDIKNRHTTIMNQVYRQYGTDWDMLFIGHCTSDANEPGLVQPHLRKSDGQLVVGFEDREKYLARNLTLYDAEYPMCLHAYAVSRECAKRLVVVLEERLRTVGQDIDLVLAIGVEFGMATVLGTSPPYMVQVGRQELASDLTQLRDGDTAQRLSNSTLFKLGLRRSDPRSLAPYMDWQWFTVK
ncbi:hypothetical protein H4R99_004214 [Coemansia sp. RSA 1722]|nr:hypothetical protein H4R99_004214 [Coemansia sp. RSA 1722]